MKLHVNRFGVFGSYCAGSEANSAHVVAEYFSRGLGIANAMQDIAESDTLCSIDEHCGVFGLGNGGDDNGIMELGARHGPLLEVGASLFPR